MESAKSVFPSLLKSAEFNVRNARQVREDHVSLQALLSALKKKDLAARLLIREEMPDRARVEIIPGALEAL